MVVTDLGMELSDVGFQQGLVELGGGERRRLGSIRKRQDVVARGGPSLGCGGPIVEGFLAREEILGCSMTGGGVGWRRVWFGRWRRSEVGLVAANLRWKRRVVGFFVGDSFGWRRRDN